MLEVLEAARGFTIAPCHYLPSSLSFEVHYRSPTGDYKTYSSTPPSTINIVGATPDYKTYCNPGSAEAPPPLHLYYCVSGCVVLLVVCCWGVVICDVGV